MNFDFATATKIIFGPGSSSQLVEMAKPVGKRPLFILGKQKIGKNIIDSYQGWEKVNLVQVENEPKIDLIQEIVQFARNEKTDLVISIGGGSTIDSGKAVAGLITNTGEVTDYLEVIGKNLQLTQIPVPFFALPTTAGTGAEVTRNAVISIPEKKVKVSLRSPYLYPTCAIIDPRLTYSMPPTVTANTGMDALTQVFEPFVSNKANWMTDMFCIEGLGRIGRSLAKAYLNGADEQARENMSWGSLLGGLALANAGLGAVHGFAGPIGGMIEAPHGAICAAILAAATEINIKTLQLRAPQHPALKKYLQAGKLIFGEEINDYKKMTAGLKDLCETIHIQGLKTFGINEKDINYIVEKSAQASSMKGNPIVLENGELKNILFMSL